MTGITCLPPAAETDPIALGTAARKVAAPSASIKQRIIELDLLRCIAILLVLGAHPVVHWQSPGEVPWLIYGWFHVGYTGVDLFFVLSGFLIAGLIFSEYRATGEFQKGRFWIRRALKIWPAYYIYLIILFATRAMHGHSLAPAIPFLLHFQNYSQHIDTARHCWSLAVEEHFYLILPLVLGVTLSVLSPRRVLAAAALLGVASAIMRFYATPGLPAVLSHLRFDTLFLGVALAYVYHYHPMRLAWISRHRLALGCAGAAVVLCATIPSPVLDNVSSRWQTSLVPIVVGLGYALVLMALVSHRAVAAEREAEVRRGARYWMIKLLAAIGLYSYPIYLWHYDGAFKIVYPLVESGWLGPQDSQLRWAIGTSLYVTLAVGAGVLVSRCLEVPILMLRDRLFPRAAAPV